MAPELRDVLAENMAVKLTVCLTSKRRFVIEFLVRDLARISYMTLFMFLILTMVAPIHCVSTSCTNQFRYRLR